MLQFDKEKMKGILIEDLEYKDWAADITVEALGNLDESLQSVLDVWIETRTVTEFSFDGLSLRAIMEKDRCSFVTALIHMSTFMHEPWLRKEYMRTPFILRQH